MSGGGSKLRRTAAIVGVGHTDWVGDYKAAKEGKVHTDASGLAAISFVNALADAELKKSDIDGLIVGPPTSYERMGEVLGLDVKWGGSADAVTSIAQACMAIECGFAEVVALVYGNDQRSAGTQYGGPEAMGGDAFLSYVYHAPWGLTSQGALYAMLFQRYCQTEGFDPADLGHVAVAERAWAALNPNAIMRTPITLEEYAASRFIVEPLRLFDYCLINDGGVALIVAEAGRAKKMAQQPVFIESIGRHDLNQGATSLDLRLTNYYLPAQQAAAKASYDIAGVGPQDMDLFQVYDSFSVHVPLALEGYGYCQRGDAGKFMREQGIGPGGKLPLNTGGGHLSESYMQGWAHQIECVRQLRGGCGPRQIEGARLAHYTSDIAGKAFSIIYSK